jgi:hypothetical protein
LKGKRKRVPSKETTSSVVVQEGKVNTIGDSTLMGK